MTDKLTLQASIDDLAKELGNSLLKKKWRIATAESCTGGGIASAITEIPGSSQWFDRGFVTYSNEAKIDLLDVKLQTLHRFGAVSAETAREMAAGCLANSQADIAISVTGIAGPTGGTNEKPVGTVFIGLSTKGGQAKTIHKLFHGNRHLIRQQTVIQALQLIMATQTI
jgi:nicotinamide-nucleotide amidase